MKINAHIFSLLLIVLMTASCGSRPAADTADAPAYEERGAFSADSAMAYAAAQVAFGPRVPGTAAHSRCADWLASELRRHGADTVTVSAAPVTAWNGDRLTIRNIFARFNSRAEARVILLAHYDTRPWADMETDPAAIERPIDGANDGASGVAVLLEVARNLALERPEIGVDILLTDCEDYGARADAPSDEESWALGARHFADNLPYAPGQYPRYGILLDMVGAKGARFNREYFSTLQAPAPTAKVWAMASKLGLDDRFPTAMGGAVTDDHMPLINAGIPVTDIIESHSASTGAFPATWHTHADNLSNLSTESLSAAGRVVLNVIYNEKP